jgi:coniferyl-aldehyde dehydrogenase
MSMRVARHYVSATPRPMPSDYFLATCASMKPAAVNRRKRRPALRRGRRIAGAGATGERANRYSVKLSVFGVNSVALLGGDAVAHRRRNPPTGSRTAWTGWKIARICNAEVYRASTLSPVIVPHLTVQRSLEAAINANIKTPEDSGLSLILKEQRDSFLADGAPSLALRRTTLRKLKDAILVRRRDFEDAISADFGNRSRYETAVMEIMPVTQGIDYLQSNLRRWMRPRRRHVSMQYQPASAKTVMQPLGVVGIVSPWNYPLALCLTPLATALAAGNRVMLKPSEYTPKTSALMASMLAEIFLPKEVAVVTGGADVGAFFTALQFDHLFFTGSTDVGRVIMRNASENLVPVTLELGGKSPVIVDEGFSTIRAVKAIVYGKLSNAGQTCVATDYAFVHESQIDAFVSAFEAEARRAYPQGVGDKGFASIISQRHFDRLVSLIEDARQKGAKIVQIGVTSVVGRARTIPPTMIIGATSEMKVMQQEIFGPILPIVSYQKLSDAVSQINAGDRPLALYVFSDRPQVIDHVLAATTSGSAVVNDTLLQFVQDDLPFGGVGPSGMGSYHGEEGFRTFSHTKSVFTQARFNAASIMRAPFGRLADRILGFLLP